MPSQYHAIITIKINGYENFVRNNSHVYVKDCITGIIIIHEDRFYCRIKSKKVWAT